MQCEWLLPTHEPQLSPDGQSYHCVLEEGHEGPHVIGTYDNKEVEWEPDTECADCSPEELCECFVWGYTGNKRTSTLV